MVSFSDSFYAHLEVKYQDKPLIICLVGDSGSGKTFIAHAIRHLFGIPPLPSYTTRPKRTPTETAHVFLDDKSFNALTAMGVLAITEFGGYMYAGLQKDVKCAQTYVVDEIGLKYIMARHSDKYTIVTVKVKSRYRDVDKTRRSRDVLRAVIPDHKYDYIIYNGGAIILMTQLLLIISDYITEEEIIYGD